MFQTWKMRNIAEEIYFKKGYFFNGKTCRKNEKNE
jgi:hypothetical protein